MKGACAGWMIAAALVLAGCEGRPRSNAPSEHRDDRRSGPAVAVLDLSDSVPEQSSAGLLGLSAKAATLEDLIGQAERLDHDKDVRGVLVRLGTARIGLARAFEAGAILATLRAKWPVWCHADDLNNDTLALAARGCTRVWVSPASSVDAIGLAAQTMYFHKLLVDELGLDVDFLQVGKFKGAEEPFTRDGPSPEARQSLESTLADLRGAWIDEIRTGRPQGAEAAAEDGPYAAEDAKHHNLIDEVGYLDEARDALEKATGAVRSQVRLGPGASSVGGDDLSDLLRSVVGDSFGSAPIAIVPAVGAISMDGGGIVGGSGGIVARRMLRLLSRLEKDDDVKAVVLRIDSPGGSALASDLLWHELMRIRARKTLVVSIGDMAASGGYYLASTGVTVFADETSIVGSIGVVGGKIAADRALEKIGVHAETFPARRGDGAEARAAYESLLVPWDDATRARMLATMTGIYSLFLSRVSEGRGIPVERVAQSAEGRIFSGRDGKTRGLVDTIGGLREALAKARELAGLGADARVAITGEEGGLLQMFASDEASSDSRATLLREALAAEAVAATSKSLDVSALPSLLGRFVASLLPLAGEERVLCALPFALTVR